MCLAIPGRITRITDADPLSRRGAVQFGGATKEINLSLVPEANVGDYVLVHVGFAISRIDEREAARVFDYLEEIDELGGLQEGGGDEVPR